MRIRGSNHAFGEAEHPNAPASFGLQPSSENRWRKTRCSGLPQETPDTKLYTHCATILQATTNHEDSFGQLNSGSMPCPCFSMEDDLNA
jgi:hypothetical protein